MLRRIPAVMLLGMLSTSAAMAQSGELIDGSRPQVLLNMARSYGTAELTKDSDGDPLIKGRMDGSNYFILFYGCNKNERCNQIEFRHVLDSSHRVDFDAITDWHRKFRYGKVYIDNSDDVILNYFVNLRGDGVSRSNLQGSFDWFKQMVAAFHKEVGATTASRRDDSRSGDDRRDDARDRDRDRDDDRDRDRDRDSDRDRPTVRDTTDSDRDRASDSDRDKDRARDERPPTRDTSGADRTPPRLPTGIGQN
jgi:hypothetical protein